MRQLDRYINRTVFMASMLVLLVVLSLDFVFGLINELKSLQNGYQITQAFMYMVLSFPDRLYQYLPVGAFMGCLIGLGSLANTSELTVIRAAGVSIRRIVWSAMKPALVIVIVGLLLGQFVAPYFQRIAESDRQVERGDSNNLAASGGLWHREGQTFMHFNAVQPNGVLHGVSLFKFDDKHWLQSATFAGRAIYQNDHWLLERVVTTNLTPTGTSVERHATEVWHSSLSPHLLNVLSVDPDNLSISGLYTYARYLGKQDLNAKSYWLAFWKKVLRPLATGVLVLVAISFVFGPLRSVTMGFRVFTGIVVGLLFKYVQDLLGPTSLVFGFSPILATLVPIVICAVIGLVLIRRVG